jgi:hypothetical protein
MVNTKRHNAANSDYTLIGSAARRGHYPRGIIVRASSTHYYTPIGLLQNLPPSVRSPTSAPRTAPTVFSHSQPPRPMCRAPSHNAPRWLHVTADILLPTFERASSQMAPVVRLLEARTVTRRHILGRLSMRRTPGVTFSMNLGIRGNHFLLSKSGASRYTSVIERSGISITMLERNSRLQLTTACGELLIVAFDGKRVRLGHKSSAASIVVPGGL